jgi:hypothetical protein
MAVINAETRRGIQASIAELFNSGFSSASGLEGGIVTQEDVNITRIAPGSVVVEFEVLLPSTPLTLANGTQLTASQVEEAAVIALELGTMSDSEAASRVFESNGVGNVGEVSVEGQPAVVQGEVAEVTPAPPLPQPDSDGRKPWWDPSQPLMMGIIAIAALIVLAFLVGLIVWLVLRRSSKVKPSGRDGADVEAGTVSKRLDGEHQDDDNPPRPYTPPLPKETAPPWDPPAPNVKPKAPKPPNDFEASFSIAPAKGAEPYERLILISSRIPGVKHVAQAALSGCAVGVYDWGSCTLHELLSHVEGMLGGHEVSSVAVMAPAGKGGAVGLVTKYQTTAEKLSRRAELANFWKGLAGHVVRSDGADDRRGRIDLLSCRVTESPEKGPQLLEALTGITKRAVAASDDFRQGFPLFHSAQSEGESAQPRLPSL